jgi:hypothetical protein
MIFRQLYTFYSIRLYILDKSTVITDGSDHRSCCAHASVERGCLDWCRGEPLFAQDNKVCLLQHTKKIISCFREGRGIFIFILI